MVIRLFLILFLVNTAAFAVKAKAGEFDGLSMDALSDIEQLQSAMSGDFAVGAREDALTELGSRLLTWRFSDGDDRGEHYASEPLQADHGVAFLDDGACLNLKWDF